MYTLWGVFEDCLASFGGNVFSNTPWQCRNEREVWKAINGHPLLMWRKRQGFP